MPIVSHSSVTCALQGDVGPQGPPGAVGRPGLEVSSALSVHQAQIWHLNNSFKREHGEGRLKHTTFYQQKNPLKQKKSSKYSSMCCELLAQNVFISMDQSFMDQKYFSLTRNEHWDMDA